MPKYDLKVQAIIELGGEFEGETLEQASTNAKLELRQNGEINEIHVFQPSLPGGAV